MEFKVIHDTYFDTKDEILKKNEIALRIREIDEQVTKITLKINSYLNLNIFNDHLKHYNIDLKLTLINSGFKLIQN